jgi:hypothetical protein
MKTKIKVRTDVFDKQVEKIDKSLKDVSSQAHKFFVSITPINKGNARRRTRLVNGNIEANYNYAEHLDEGSSKQAPQGMTEPTIKHIEKVLIPNAIRKIK